MVHLSGVTADPGEVVVNKPDRESPGRAAFDQEPKDELWIVSIQRRGALKEARRSATTGVARFTSAIA